MAAQLNSSLCLAIQQRLNALLFVSHRCFAVAILGLSMQCHLCSCLSVSPRRHAVSSLSFSAPRLAVSLRVDSIPFRCHAHDLASIRCLIAAVRDGSPQRPVNSSGHVSHHRRVDSNLISALPLRFLSELRTSASSLLCTPLFPAVSVPIKALPRCAVPSPVISGRYHAIPCQLISVCAVHVHSLALLIETFHHLFQSKLCASPHFVSYFSLASHVISLPCFAVSSRCCPFPADQSSSLSMPLRSMPCRYESFLSMSAKCNSFPVRILAPPLAAFPNQLIAAPVPASPFLVSSDQRGSTQRRISSLPVASWPFKSVSIRLNSNPG